MTIVKSEVCFISGELDLVGIEKGQNSYLPLSVQTLSRVRLFATHGLQHARLPCLLPTSRACSNSCPLSQWWHPTISTSIDPFSSCPQSFPASGSPAVNLALRIRWPKDWNFSISISPFSADSGLISFRIDWFDLLAVQRTLKSLLQHHGLKASILWRSAFCMVQLPHLNITTGKTIALTIQISVGKVMSLLLIMLFRLVIAFLPRSKCLLISGLQSPSAVILETEKINSLTVSVVSSSICHEGMGHDVMILVFWMLSLNITFSLSSSISSRGPLVILCFLPYGWCYLCI